MTPAILVDSIIEPALKHLLPARMNSREARVMLTAIALQETDLRHRKQVRGPARGFWQFELGGLSGVLRHHATRDHAARVVGELLYSDLEPAELHQTLADNDLLACCMARLNLWWLPDALPTTAGEGWQQYESAWRPGKPHPERWVECWEAAVRAA